MEQKLREMLQEAREAGVRKAELRAKYGIESNKATEVEKAILAKAMELRRGYECSEIGLSIFSRYWNYPESPAKIKQAFAEEGDEFIRYYIEAIRPSVEKNNARRYYGRAWDGRIDRLEAILNERAKASDNGLQNMIARLLEETAEFHRTFVENLVAYEMRRFAYFKEYKALKACVSEKYLGKEGGYRYEKYVYVYKDNECELPENLNVRWMNAFNDIKIHSDGFKAEVYEAYVRNCAESEFIGNINLVAERAYKAGMGAEAIKVVWASEHDAKAFEMVLTDGAKKMHCRSVFCAEYSVLVTPHWRFIITNCK